MKKAILAISFGTSYLDTLDKTIGAVEDRLRKEFDAEVFRAFTSSVIINKLRERDGLKTDSVSAALGKLCRAGYTEVFCAPTHIMSGAEYDKAKEEALSFSDKLNIHISRPLISVTDDYFDIVRIFKNRLTDKNRLYIFMGHGSDHSANSLYSALDYHFKNAGMDNVYVGTVEGFPDLETVIKNVLKTGIRDVTLMPLMLVCGEHAREDMAKEWKSKFEENGFKVTCDMTGLGEIEEIRGMYAEHLRDIWEK